VPTPSAEATRIGYAIFGNAPENIPPKLPISVKVRSLKVDLAKFLIFATAKFALSIETPASEYEIESDIIFERKIIDFLRRFNQNRKQIKSPQESVEHSKGNFDNFVLFCGSVFFKFQTSADFTDIFALGFAPKP